MKKELFKSNLGLSKIAQPIRILVTGGTVSPPVDVTLQLLGKSQTIQRMDGVLAPTL